MQFWYKKNPTLASYCLTPAAWCFKHIIKHRRKKLEKKRQASALPVVVVGNITVGGTGKTPFVIWLSQYLTKQGWRVGIVSRGYKAQTKQFPHLINIEKDTCAETGDEPYLIAQKTGLPIVIDRDRAQAVQYLKNHTDCNIVISDDGLQHYNMPRVMEIAIIDGARQLGNGKLIPAGPLREPVSRLREIELVISNNAQIELAKYMMTFKHQALHNLKDPTQTLAIDTLKNKTIHAVTGIGNPQRFFNSLSALGMNVLGHAFSDHHNFTAKDFNFSKKANTDIVIMTEKDAVKCQHFAQDNWWTLPIEAELPKAFIQALNNELKLLNGLKV